ncbi:ribonuclease HI [Vibrio phage JSF12]|uniref:ribonuclease H n=2 Tax=Jesfedecavirus TaxID=2560156 RepID=A0A2D0YLQ9_9CAUD|nr:Rnase H [Vibrio phage JSF10]YP_009794696.1 Rnase H [Vibrio phage JSF12]ASV43416.1 ribonuclease HI [Vibrio phage JSF10]ASV43531.1 ribonuclease HI [Vibrio phage JSF12]
MSNISVWTDGACRGNPGIGAWAMVVYEGHMYKGKKVGFSEVTTNNEMELTAVVEAAKWALRLGKPVSIHTDSAYVCNGFNDWMHKWAKNHWRNSTNGTIKNLKLWQDLYFTNKDLIAKGITIQLVKVKGHSGLEGNEMADNLCNCEMDAWELQNKVMV